MSIPCRTFQEYLIEVCTLSLLTNQIAGVLESWL
jgi:hypothetical protein